MEKYLEETPILNFSHPSIVALLRQRDWAVGSVTQKVKRIYDFVRDEIPFGYNASDALTASEILQDGYGQCNTKSTLLMALLRAVGIPNRIHGFTINKTLQKGAVTGIWYQLSPRNILHSWVEVYVEGEWYFLEGVILDKPYLQALQARYPDCQGSFCGFGVATEQLQNPEIEWQRNHTFIQKEGINQDFGLFDTPDQFYARHQQKMGPLKKLIYRWWVRKLMNRNVRRIRGANCRHNYQLPISTAQIGPSVEP